MAKVLIIRERPIGSILADTYTFAVLTALLIFNRYALGDHWYLALPFLGFWIMLCVSFVSNRKFHYKTYDEAIAALNLMKEKKL